RRQQLDDEPAQRVERKLALDLVRIKLRTELHLAADSLRLVSDSTVSQPQRSDWYFTFTHALPSDTSATLEVKLAGEAITQLSYEGFSPMAGTAPAESPRNRRTIGLALILIGVFLSMHYHRTPLAIRAGVLWAGVLFLLAVAVRALTFSQAVILMPWDSPLTGYLSRVALAGFIESLQAAIVLGMVVATGESLSRDVFRGSTSLSRLAPGLLGWRAAWARAARWALPCAAVVVVYETLASHYLTPLGLAGKVPDMIANALSSPWPYAALPAQIAVSVLWEETVFRLWLIALVIFWMRSPVMAVLLTAATATWFAGYDLSQFMTAGALFYVLWAIIAGWLIVRVGIVSAMLFHALSVGAYATLVMMWTGFGAAIGVTTLSVILLLILVIARDSTPRAQPAPVVVE
ncbi:hypothetical protein KJ815_11040, partial [bacterium]|nr:hypothetical protein [bacterium]